MSIEKPKIVTLCGSTKFKKEFIEMNFKLTMMGIIVISVGWFGHTDKLIYAPSDIEKEKLDELHKRKIDLSDSIFVIDVGGYIGNSTRNEIAYAESKGLPVEYYSARS